MKIRSIVSSKKIAVFTLFVASILATLLIFNQPRAIAQNSWSSFLNSVHNHVANSCRQYGSQCGSCASNIAQNIIYQQGISNPRDREQVYNAAISACR